MAASTRKVKNILKGRLTGAIKNAVVALARKGRCARLLVVLDEARCVAGSRFFVFPFEC